MTSRERFEREQFEAWHKWAGYSEDYRETRCWRAWCAAAETFAKRIAELEADAGRLDWLESMANKTGGLLLHDGSETGRTGIGLRPGAVVRTLRAAIDAAKEE